jgi:hypothetical protein
MSVPAESLGSLESALGAAFSDAPAEPVEKPAAPRQAAPKQEAPLIEEEPLDAPLEADPADLLEGQEVEAEPVADPEFEIEIEPGKTETLPLAKLKELAARGAKAGRGFEENARVREALQAHVNQTQLQTHFQQAVSPDIAQVHALEQQLQAYQRIDWSAEYDRDPFNAMKLKEQRDQLREQRAAAIQGSQRKAAAVPGSSSRRTRSRYWRLRRRLSWRRCLHGATPRKPNRKKARFPAR